jgi:hypothetical protein
MMGFGFLLVALLGSASTTLISVMMIGEGLDEGPLLLSYVAAVAVLCGVGAAALALSRRFKRMTGAVFLGAGVLALGAVIAATIIVQNGVGGLPLEAYLRALAGPVLMILPGALDVRVTLRAERQGRDTPESSRQQENV